ncbi:acyltransferase [Leifsonia sp. NPDC058248]|uniref:acyltransferase n=1 Tax=Leifsonia sp. NPDC058248 TaxID=3346402 RepID=UPI0036D807EA
MTTDIMRPKPSADGTRTRSVSLDVLRVVAILGVIAIHVFGGIVGNQAIRGSGTWWAATAVDIGNVWVIPVFVMVSGALLLGPRAQSAGPAAFYRKRLIRLGPAFIAWQLFYLIVVRLLLSHQHLSLVQLLGLVAAGTAYTHLYFLWLIVGLYLIAPVLAAFLNQGGQRRAFVFAGSVLAFTVSVVALSGLSAYFGAPNPIVLNALTQWMPYVGYFLAGWALRNVALSWKWTLLAAVITAALLVETVWQYGSLSRPALLQAVSPAGYIGAIVAVASIGVFVVGQSIFARVTLRGRSARMLAELSDAAFGVFLVHFFFLVLAVTLFPALLVALDNHLLVAFATWAGIAVVSFAVSLGARRVPGLRRFF